MKNCAISSAGQSVGLRTQRAKSPLATGPTLSPECRDRCLACGARILWAHTGKGSSRRLNAKPTPSGKYIWEKAVDDGAPVVRLLKSRERFSADSLRYADHADTCRAVRQ